MIVKCWHEDSPMQWKNQVSIVLPASKRLVCFPPFTGNLSAQSAPSVLPQQQSLHPPGSGPETGQNHLLQPLKPSPSSENLYSAFTSDGAISIPSLSVPGQGKHQGSASWSQVLRFLGWECVSDYYFQRMFLQGAGMVLARKGYATEKATAMTMEIPV